MSELEFIPAVIALAAVCIANYTDLRKRIIPNRLTFPLIGVGIVFYVLLGIWRWDLWTTISGALGAAIAFAIGYLMWLMGGWAGGDVKLFTALGALLPFYSAPYAEKVPYPFPITVLFNSIIAIIPILLIYAVICRIRGRGILYEQVKITELKEGMIPAETIYEKNGKVERGSPKFGFKLHYDRLYANPRRAAGLTRYQVGALKRLVRERKLKNYIKLKKGIPFAPALGLGVVIAIFYGDIYWRFILALTGV
ncbi:MAG: prepilin peptidase [Candidatus Hadarchaeaceae archaeon]